MTDVAVLTLLQVVMGAVGAGLALEAALDTRTGLAAAAAVVWLALLGLAVAGLMLIGRT